MAADREVLVFPDLDVLSRAAADEIAQLISLADSGKRRFSFALSGGSTPRTLFKLLALEYRTKIRWGNVDFFWSDERCVPQTDSRSNYLMARESFLEPLRIHEEHIYAMPADLPIPAVAAADYESTLSNYFRVERPAFDLILLGMGGEGHTASLFPESPALGETKRLVNDVTAPPGIQPPRRLSFTLPMLNAAKNIFFLISGADKKDVADRILHHRSDDDDELPAGRVHAVERTVWFIDEAALQK
jgi:6-phosphogluconolactonase